MRRTLISLIRGSLLFLPSAAMATDDLPPAVAAAITAAAKTSCRSAPATLKRFSIDRQDVNGDGVPDFILTLGSVQCGDEEISDCNHSGCPKQVFASVKGGFVQVLDIVATDVQFRPVNGRPAAVADDDGWSCGPTWKGPGPTTFLWDGTRFSCAEYREPDSPFPNADLGPPSRRF